MAETGAAPFQAYIVVGGPDKYEKTRELGFTVHGFKSTRRKMAMGIRPGDRVIFYLTGLKQFAGIVRVTTKPFEDHTPIWANPKKPGEDYPYRAGIEPELVLEEPQFVDAQPLAARMTHTKRWPPENWTLAFQGNLHRISQDDYELIRMAIADARQAAATR